MAGRAPAGRPGAVRGGAASRRQARQALQAIHSGVGRFDDGANRSEVRWRRPRLDKPGRALATEVLIGTQAVRTLIRERKTHQLHSAIQVGGEAGMQLMGDSLKELYEAGIISYDEAVSRARLPEDTLSGSGGRSAQDDGATAPQGLSGRPHTAPR
jgi:hypothetical protein